MATGYGMDDLLDFLEHSSDKGLMPAATATALGVATRNVLGVLDEAEREDIRRADLDAVIKRFNNKRARDFNPSSLKEYGRRVHRAVEMFLSWRDDPANFTIKTRATPAARKKERAGPSQTPTRSTGQTEAVVAAPRNDGGYQSSFPIRPGVVVTLSNIPEDLTPAEAERLAKFVRMLAVGEEA